MPEIHFVGTIDYVDVDRDDALSVTWAMVPGSAAWVLTNGSGFGETQTGVLSETSGVVLLNHPVDVRYETSSIEGWPFFVCEVWERGMDGERSFLGCGSVWLPTSVGEHSLDIQIWRPMSGSLFGVADHLLPSIPNLKALRELTVKPYLRSQVLADTVGSASVRIGVVCSDVRQHGVLT